MNKQNKEKFDIIFKDMDNNPIFFNTVETNKFRKYPIFAKLLIKLFYKPLKAKTN